MLFFSFLFFIFKICKVGSRFVEETKVVENTQIVLVAEGKSKFGLLLR